MKLLLTMLLLSATAWAETPACPVMYKALAASEYKAPEGHLEGEDIVIQALNEANKTKGLFQGRNMEAVKNRIRAEFPGTIINDYGLNIPDSDFFPTSSPMGIRAINRLTSKKKHVIGLITKKTEWADGFEKNFAQFVNHDYGHAQLFQRLRESNKMLFDKFFANLDYDKIVSGMTESQRVKFDAGYFLYFRELGANSQLFSQLGKLGTTPDKKIIQGIYKELVANNLKVTFAGENPVVSMFHDNTYNSVLDRIHDKHDLWGILPTEVQKQIERYPEQAKQIGDAFLTESYQTFLELHYKAMLKTLGVN